LKKKPAREKKIDRNQRIMITLYKKTNERKLVYFAKDKRGKMGRREKSPLEPHHSSITMHAITRKLSVKGDHFRFGLVFIKKK
jgi:hypothetical protein